MNHEQTQNIKNKSGLFSTATSSHIKVSFPIYSYIVIWLILELTATEQMPPIGHLLPSKHSLCRVSIASTLQHIYPWLHS